MKKIKKILVIEKIKKNIGSLMIILYLFYVNIDQTYDIRADDRTDVQGICD